MIFEEVFLSAFVVEVIRFFRSIKEIGRELYGYKRFWEKRKRVSILA